MDPFTGQNGHFLQVILITVAKCHIGLVRLPLDLWGYHEKISYQVTTFDYECNNVYQQSFVMKTASDVIPRDYSLMRVVKCQLF